MIMIFNWSPLLETSAWSFNRPCVDKQDAYINQSHTHYSQFTTMRFQLSISIILTSFDTSKVAWCQVLHQHYCATPSNRIYSHQSPWFHMGHEPVVAAQNNFPSHFSSIHTQGVGLDCGRLHPTTWIDDSRGAPGPQITCEPLNDKTPLQIS